MAVNQELIRRLWLQGVGRKEVARQVGCSPSYAGKIVKDLGLPSRREHAHPLVPDSPEFRKMWDDRVPQSVIAEKYNCTEPTVARLAKKYGYPERQKPRRKRVDGAIITPPIKTEPDTPNIAGEVGELVATEGNYSKLAAIAKRKGWTLTYAQQRYHRAMSDHG